MQTYTIRLVGPGVPGDHRLPGLVLRDLLDALDRGARGAVRLRLEGRSASPGPTPGWLERASRFDLLLEPVGPDRAVRLIAPALKESLSDRFAQTELFSDPLADETPISLFASGLADVLRGRTDSEAFDEGLLRSYEELGRVFGRDVESLQIRNGHPDAAPLIVTPEAIQVVERLHEQTPRPQRVRLAGRLNAIRYSDRAFALVLAGGTSVRGVFAGDDGGVLKAHFGQVVAVSGLAHFKPSGALRVVEADHVVPATDADVAVFSTLPLTLGAGFDPRSLRVPQGPDTGLNAVFGAWPGDETDEEFEQLLDELS